MPLILLIVLALVTFGDVADAKGKRTSLVSLTWDYTPDPKMPSELLAFFRVLRAKTCADLSPLVNELGFFSYVDAPPFPWHQACYQVVAVSMTGKTATSNQEVATW